MSPRHQELFEQPLDSICVGPIDLHVPELPQLNHDVRGDEVERVRRLET